MRRYEIVYDDGTSQLVVVKPVDIVAAERHFELSIAQMEANPRGEHSYFLVWSVEKRRDPGLPDFDEWLPSADEIRMAPPADPTPAPTGQPRSTSKRARTTSASRAS